MNDRQHFPNRLTRRRTSILDDGPIKIYETGGSPQVASGVSIPAVAAIIGFAAIAGLTTIHFLGRSAATGEAALAAIEAPASETAMEETGTGGGADEVAAADTVRTAALAVSEANTPVVARASATAERLPVKRLKRDDPRWSAGATAAAASPAAAAIKALAEDYQSDEAPVGSSELMAFASRPGSPGEAIESISEPEDDGMDEAETAAVPPAREAPAAAPPPAVSRNAQVRSAVNMRSRPRQGASVMTVIPARASVGVVDCDLWCQVVYEGRSGYVFRDFVEGRARMAAEPVAARTGAARPTAEAVPEAAAPARADAATAPEEGTPLADHIAAGNRGR